MPAAVGRLKRRAEFLRVAGTKRRFITPGLVLQMRPWATGALEEDEQVQHSLRLGFTVSKKVGNAVERNRARRRLRAAAADVMGHCAAPRRDYVIIGRRAALSRPYPALVQDLKTALHRLRACRADTGGEAGPAPDRQP